MTEAADDRGLFSNIGRTLDEEDEIRLTSVGVDIGSSTSHLVFSRIVMERVENRYVVTERHILHESDVLLTPYADNQTIDADTLGAFINEQYRRAGMQPGDIDSGALILTGVAVRRWNARAIGELFAGQAGKFVAVSAGDALETMLMAFGSGAAARSIRDRVRIMNVDIGGGTSKIAVCEQGEVRDMTVIDVGARVLSLDQDGRIERVEEAGHRFAEELGIGLAPGGTPSQGDLQRLAERMADRLFQAMGARPLEPQTRELLRLAPLKSGQPPDIVTFSGGVSEYLYGREQAAYGDLGPLLAEAVRQRMQQWGPALEAAAEGIRATVVGASQYTVQVSGSTIYVQPHDTLPLRNIPVIHPDLPLAGEALDPAAIADRIAEGLARLDLQETERPVALFFHWLGSATYARLDAFCQGLTRGLAPVLSGGRPLVLVNDGDVGGLIGLHLSESSRQEGPVVSVDGILLNEFDFIDLGALLEVSGAVPVVIKSLVFPESAALGRSRGSG